MLTFEQGFKQHLMFSIASVTLSNIGFLQFLNMAFSQYMWCTKDFKVYLVYKNITLKLNWINSNWQKLANVNIPNEKTMSPQVELNLGYLYILTLNCKSFLLGSMGETGDTGGDGRAPESPVPVWIKPPSGLSEWQPYRGQVWQQHLMPRHASASCGVQSLRFFACLVTQQQIHKAACTIWRRCALKISYKINY